MITIMIIILMVIPLLLTSSLSSSLCNNVSSIEYSALVDLYYSTNGSRWNSACSKDWLDTSVSPCSWYGIACNSACQVVHIELGRCRLRGTIPTQLGVINALRNLQLYSNSIKGTIPIQLCNLINIEVLYLDENKLHGTIPTQLGSLTKLQNFSISVNSLTGTIPTQLGNLNNMVNIYLDENNLNGTIPTQLANLINLQELNLYTNSLTGTIPTQLGSLINLQYLDLNTNSLHGTIPTQLGNLPNLTHLYLNINSLVGTIPTQLGNLINLQLLNLYINSLTGTIPTQLGSLINLQDLYVDINSLTGTIPTQLGNLVNLQELSLNANSLTSTIPTQLGSLIKMADLRLDTNSLTGTIPTQLGNLVNLQWLYLYANSLTGTIPTQVGELTNLDWLLASNNKLSGSIPAELGKLKKMQYLYLQDNALSGIVSANIMYLPAILAIDLSNNQLLGGSLDSLFNANTSLSLMYVMLSSMSLQGTLPDKLFHLPLLNTLLLSSNCITGSFPSGICKSRAQYLVLDGIGTGSNCPVESFQGTIPSCVLSLSNAISIQIAGNGLQGSIPDIPMNSSLQLLNLARNRLTGSIPISVQTYTKFTSVDLSSNKLSGTLVDTFQCPSQSLNMSVNRLSGKPVQSLRNTSVTVNVIDGNLLGCPVLKNDISNRDDSEASCGSSNLETPFYVWLISLVSVLISFLVFYFFNIMQKSRQCMSEWWSFSRCCSSSENGSSSALTTLYHTKSAVNGAECVSSVSLVLTALYVFVVMMTYIGIKLRNTSDILYQVQYLYTTTSAYLRGSTPTLVLWFCITISGFIVVVFSIVSRPSQLQAASSSSSDVNRIESSDNILILSHFRPTMIAILVVGISFAINYGFVRIVYFDKPSHLSFIQFAFAIIKNILGTFIVPYSAKTVPKSRRQLYTVVITIIVNIIAPGLAVLMTSPLCLLYYLTKNSITIPYEYPQLVSVLVKSNLYSELVRSPASSTFVPPWFYSYQCSSAFLTSYLPNFIYLYTISGIVSPLLNLTAMVLLSAKYKNYIKRANVLLEYFLGITIGKIFYVMADNIEVKDTEMAVLSIKEKKESTVSRVVIDVSTTSTASSEKIERYKVDVSDIMPSLIVDITVLLTFGLASPLLSITISFSIIANVVVMRLALGRYIAIVTDALDEKTCYELLESAFNEEWRCLSESWWVMSFFIGLFWSLVVNDTVGDYNPKGGIIAAVVMILWCPLVFISAQYLLTHHCSSIRDRLEKASRYVHSTIWRHKDIDSTVTDNNSIIKETFSPLGSLSSSK